MEKQGPDDPLTRAIIGCAVQVYRELGPGLLESAYEACLCKELLDSGRRVQRQVSLPVEYKGLSIDAGYRVDLLVDDQVIVELKAVEEVTSLHKAQLLTYMRLSQLRIGLLLNFNCRLMQDGVHRLVLSAPRSVSALSALSAVKEGGPTHG